LLSYVVFIAIITYVVWMRLAVFANQRHPVVTRMNTCLAAVDSFT